MSAPAILHLVAALLLAPLLLGVVQRTKARFAGRRGPPVLQPWYDVVKQFRKGAVYSATTSRVFRLGPCVGFAGVAVALSIAPWGGGRAMMSFEGDLLLFAYALAAARFATILAALDTGSAFEGMGASREAAFSALAEPALLVGLLALARAAGSLSISEIFHVLTPGRLAASGGVAVLLVAAAFGIVFLAENARIPVDDPATHLELTMIHEVMVLDHSGPDFGLIQYAAALKFWVLGTLVAGFFFPARENAWLALGATVAGVFVLAVAVGVVESVMARLRLSKVPHLLAGALALSVLALVLSAFSRGNA
ncbi:MAG: NADH-quinone oxidoreductase subunit H [Verrucomicrobiae bacterium]|nr:NADH-quinone oxidoreductase subunit H [Verrucomicrobiae bacterium]